MLAACGGNDEDELLRGVFSDSPVGGLNYVTDSTGGVTDADGVFYYREGESVVFRVGRMALPAVLASPMVTPLDMSVEGEIDDPVVVNIARLLQSLDEDADPENGIVIPQAANIAFTEFDIFDAMNESALESVVSQVHGDSRAVVSADQAISHFVDTLSTNAESNGTLDQLSYIVSVDETYNSESLFVDQDTFSMTLDGEVHTGTVSINKGVYQLSGVQDTFFVSIDDAADKKLACIESVPTAVTDCDGDLYQVFVDEAQAMAFNASQNIAATEALPEPETGAATDANESAATTEEISLEEFFPRCFDGIVDDDGDGYGWQNDQTCLIVVDGEIVAENLIDNEATAPDPEIEPAPEEVTPEVEIELAPEEVTPEVEIEPAPEEVTTELEIDPAPDEITPEPEIEPAPEEVTTDTETEPVAEEMSPDPETDNTVTQDVNAVPVVIQPSDITDIIVLTGQSNASGVETGFDATLDAGNERLFAFNEDGQWQVADLDQYWDENLPSNFAAADEGREPYNNLVFQVGKSLSEQTDRVVGVILVTAPGAGISNWDYNSEFYTKIRNKVTDALATLPQKDSVDAMIWMQGETDWLAEGTADPSATGFASFDSDFYRNYYPNKLNQLINNLRSEFWYASEAQFICAETKKTNLNHHLMALNGDGDDRTSCAQASDLPTRDSDPFGNHYSAAGLRTLGDRIAALYLSGAG